MKNEYVFILGALFGAALGMMYEQYRFDQFKKRVQERVKETVAPAENPTPRPDAAA